jgi:hypothetical protein
MSGALIGTGYSRTFDARHATKPCPQTPFLARAKHDVASFLNIRLELKPTRTEQS